MRLHEAELYRPSRRTVLGVFAGWLAVAVLIVVFLAIVSVGEAS